MRRYILDEQGQPVIENDPLIWDEYFCKHHRVAKDIINGARVSTVFLGIDHSFNDEGPPVLWETMIFDCAKYDGYQRRYTSLADAIEGHKQTVTLVTKE